jgi:hypothetical protein
MRFAYSRPSRWLEPSLYDQSLQIQKGERHSVGFAECPIGLLSRTSHYLQLYGGLRRFIQGLLTENSFAHLGFLRS